MRVVCLYFIQEHPLQKIAESLYRFTPQITVRSNQIFLEISKCKKLYSEKSLLFRIQIILKKFKIQAVITIAGDIPTALACAKHQQSSFQNLPIEALQEYLPFDSDLDLSEMIHLLHKMGIHYLYQFKKIPLSMIPSRFEKKGLIASQYLENPTSIVWPIFRIRSEIEAQIEIEDSSPIENTESLFFLVKNLLDQATAQLRGRLEKALQIELIVQQENYSTVRNPVRKWNLEFSFPLSSSRSILEILRERVHQELSQQPLQAPLIFIQVKILKTTPASGAQKNFFHSQEEEKEVLNSFINRIVERIGESNIFFAQPIERYLPEKSWKKTLKTIHSILHPSTPKRPLRVFKTPIPIYRIGNRICSSKEKWKVLHYSEVERLQGEWWEGEFKRDYFQVDVDNGKVFWIYKDLHSQKLYIHGEFD